MAKLATTSRTADKRSRPITIRLPLEVEEALSVCAEVEQTDVAGYITDILIQFQKTNPVQNRIHKIRSLASSDPKAKGNTEIYLRGILETRFPGIDYNWDSYSATERIFKRKEI